MSKTILIVTDFDSTWYNRQNYQYLIEESKGIEASLIANRCSFGATAQEVLKNLLLIKSQYKYGDYRSTSQIIIDDIGFEAWSKIRAQTTWYKYLRPKPSIAKALKALPNEMKLVIGSNTPVELVIKGIKKICPDYKPLPEIYDPGRLQQIKPNKNFFTEISRLEEMPPSRCIHIGDRWSNDIQAAIEAGYLGSFITRGQLARTIRLISKLWDKKQNLTDFKNLVHSHCYQAMHRYLKNQPHQEHIKLKF